MIAVWKMNEKKKKMYTNENDILDFDEKQFHNLSEELKIRSLSIFFFHVLYLYQRFSSKDLRI